MRRGFATRACGALLLAILSTQAEAAFELIAPPPPAPPPAATAPDAATAPLPTGAPPSQAAAPITATPLDEPGATTRLEARVRGYGRDLPLQVALGQIVPTGTRPNIAPGVNPLIPVSWQGNNRPWKQVLDDALAPARLQASYETGAVTISTTVMAAEPAVPTATPVAPSASSTAPPAPAVPAAAPVVKPAAHQPDMAEARHTPAAPAAPDAPAPPSVVTAPAVLPLPANTPLLPSAPPAQDVRTGTPAKLRPDDPATVRTWTVRAGASLYETLTEWSAAVGYGVPRDDTGRLYRNDYGATFDGSLADALDWLMSGYAETGAAPDWRYYAWTNQLKIVPTTHHSIDHGGL